MAGVALASVVGSKFTSSIGGRAADAEHIITIGARRARGALERPAAVRRRRRRGRRGAARPAVVDAVAGAARHRRRAQRVSGAAAGPAAGDGDGVPAFR